MATNLASLGTPPHIVERILNHAGGTFAGVAGVYNRFEYGEEMHAALRQWAEVLIAAVTRRQQPDLTEPAVLDAPRTFVA